MSLHRSPRARHAAWLAVILLFTPAVGETAGKPVRAREASWPAVQVWRQPQGLPQNTVFSILQTRDGYLWMGTRGGVSRFDGVRFTTFDDRGTNQLKENEVWALAEGDDGSVWIGTYGGGVSRFKDGTFTAYTTDDGLLNNFVSNVHKGPDGAIWIASDAGLSYFKDGRFTNYTTKDGLAHQSIRGLYTDRDGSLWIGTTRGGINRFKDGRFITEHLDGPQPRTDVVSFHRDKEQTLWIGTWDGLFALRDGRSTQYLIEDGLPSTSGPIRRRGPGRSDVDRHGQWTRQLRQWDLHDL